MSAIRPPAPSAPTPSQTPAAPARAMRADFFRAALQAAAPAALAAPVGAPARPKTTLDEAAAPDRAQRPGSLLDIRV